MKNEDKKNFVYVLSIINDDDFSSPSVYSTKQKAIDKLIYYYFPDNEIKINDSMKSDIQHFLEDNESYFYYNDNVVEISVDECEIN